MTKKALVILAEGFEDIEAITPIDLLRRARIDVTVAGLGSKQIRGSHGQIRIETDIIFKRDCPDYDAIILPGGMPGAQNLADSAALNSLLLKMHAQQKIIAAICAAPARVLAPQGILDNRDATCFPGAEKAFTDKIRFKSAPVIIDGHIITSQGAGTAFEFGLAIIEQLTDKETRDKVAKATVYPA
ncbi:MAG: DJ-1/PfpI family protein [Candidatus Omnitrophica bacterium]|nr:DJ-1/PfpI family protein [Candidatus Omnitrophota bacterium]